MEEELNIRVMGRAVIRKLINAGHEAFFVGGCVRDTIMGREPHDFDIVTSAEPDEITALFPDNITIGKAFGIVTVFEDPFSFEVATFRADEGGSDGRHPDKIKRVETIEEDLARRDFTCNAMAMTFDNKIIDPFDGIDDINCGVLRFVGNPKDRIQEDRLRILRAIRFAAQLGFTFEKRTRIEIANACQMGTLFASVSQERITQEFTKILLTDDWTMIQFMAENELLFQMIPELRDQRKGHNNEWHDEVFEPFGNTIFAHTMLTFVNATIMATNNPTMSPDEKLELKLAALLHDIGKPAARQRKPNGFDRFVGHDRIGARMVKEILTRMKFPTHIVDEVAELTMMHMQFHDLPKMKDVAKIRRLLGRKDLNLLLRLCISDTKATVNAENEESERLNKTELDAVEKYTKMFPEMLPEPIITGEDLIAAGLKPGPAFKDALFHSFNEQLRGKTDRDRLLNCAIGIFKQNDKSNKMDNR